MPNRESRCSFYCCLSRGVSVLTDDFLQLCVVWGDVCYTCYIDDYAAIHNPAILPQTEIRKSVCRWFPTHGFVDGLTGTEGGRLKDSGTLDSRLKAKGQGLRELFIAHAPLFPNPSCLRDTYTCGRVCAFVHSHYGTQPNSPKTKQKDKRRREAIG